MRGGKSHSHLVVLRRVVESSLEEPYATPVVIDCSRDGARYYAHAMAGGEPGGISQPGGQAHRSQSTPRPAGHGIAHRRAAAAGAIATIRGGRKTAPGQQQGRRPPP